MDYLAYHYSFVDAKITNIDEHKDNSVNYSTRGFTGEPRLLLFFTMLLAFVANTFAQESAKPLTDQEVVRRVAIIDIEGTTYENVVVSMKSTSPDYFITDKYKVKVVITDSKGKKIWKKTLKNVFLYVFSNGQVQVGKRGFDQILIQKSSYTGDFIGKIREKEGIY